MNDLSGTGEGKFMVPLRKENKTESHQFQSFNKRTIRSLVETS